MSFSAFVGALGGAQRFKQTTAVFFVSTTIESILVILLLWRGYGIYSLVIAYAAGGFDPNSFLRHHVLQIHPRSVIEFALRRRKRRILFHIWGCKSKSAVC